MFSWLRRIFSSFGSFNSGAGTQASTSSVGVGRDVVSSTINVHAAPAVTDGSVIDHLQGKRKEELERLITAVYVMRGEDPAMTGRAVEAVQALPDAARQIGRSPSIAEDALLAGHPEEAEAIYTALADGKEREGAAAYWEAAEALRHLAAIVYLNDRAKAQHVLERAAKLAPGHFDLLVELGDVARDAGDFKCAHNSYKFALEIAEKKNASRDQGKVYDRLCTLMDMIGDNTNTILYAEKALHIAESLSDLDRTDLDRKRDLYMAINKIADMKLKLNQDDEAIIFYRRSHEMRLDLSNRYANNLEYKRDLSISYEKIGAALLKKENLTEALAAHESALSIRNRASKNNPDNKDWLELRSISLNSIGMILVKLRNTTRAISVLQEGLEVSKAVALTDPTNVRRQLLLAGMHGQYGQLELSLQKKSNAQFHFLQAKAIVDQILKIAPDSAQAKYWQTALIKDLRQTDL